MHFDSFNILFPNICDRFDGDTLTLRLVVANFAMTQLCKKGEKWVKPWHMGTHLRVLSESFPMNTNKTGFDDFQKSLRSCALKERSLSIGRVNR